MLKLSGPKQDEQVGGVLPFEPQADEPTEHYAVFADFLSSNPDNTPAMFLKTRDMSLDEWIPIASRHGWISRRVDYWNYLAIRQRAKWIEMLDEALIEFKQRLVTHYKRVEQARQKEVEAGVLFSEFDRVVKTLDTEMSMAKDVINVLNSSTRDSITIVNNTVGAVSITKDVQAITDAWDAGSKDVIEGTSRRKELKKGDQDST